MKKSRAKTKTKSLRTLIWFKILRCFFYFAVSTKTTNLSLSDITQAQKEA